MSETREASWYEIALTHSQIVKIFVVMLLVLVGAFFSGIWIGRDAAVAVEEFEPVADAVPPSAVETTDGEEIAQLNFFSEDEVVPTGAVQQAEAPAPERAQPQGATDPGSGSTLLDDLSAAAAQQSGSVAQVADSSAASEPDTPVAVIREEPSPVGDATGDLVVQVFSSNDATQARRVLGRLAQGGHPAFLSPVEVEGRTMYRVRIGPYAERSRAESVADSVRRTFKLDTWITSKST